MVGKGSASQHLKANCDYIVTYFCEKTFFIQTRNHEKRFIIVCFKMRCTSNINVFYNIVLYLWKPHKSISLDYIKKILKSKRNEGKHEDENFWTVGLKKNIKKNIGILKLECQEKVKNI